MKTEISKDFETKTVSPNLASRVCTDFAESLQLILNYVWNE